MGTVLISSGDRKPMFGWVEIGVVPVDDEERDSLIALGWKTKNEKKKLSGEPDRTSDTDQIAD